MKQLDENLPADLEQFLDKSHVTETKEMLVREDSKLASDSFTKEHGSELVMVFTSIYFCLFLSQNILFLSLFSSQ